MNNSQIEKIIYKSVIVKYQERKSSNFSALFSTASPGVFFAGYLSNLSFTVKTARALNASDHLDLHDQDPKISVLLSSLGLRQSSNSLQNVLFYKKLHSNKNDKPPNKRLTNQMNLVDITKLSIYNTLTLYLLHFNHIRDDN